MGHWTNTSYSEWPLNPTLEWKSVKTCPGLPMWTRLQRKQMPAWGCSEGISASVLKPVAKQRIPLSPDPSGVQLHLVGPPCTEGNRQDRRHPTQSSQIYQARLPVQKPRLCHSYAPGARSTFTARKKTTKPAYLPLQNHRRTSAWYKSWETSSFNPQQKIDKTNKIWKPKKCSTTICKKPWAMLSHPARFNTCLQKQFLPKNNTGVEQPRQQCCLCRNRGGI